MAARKDEAGKYAPEGGLVWSGSLGRQLTDIRPIFFSNSGPGAKGLADCGILGLGGIRFLADGSYVIIPGVERGIYLFDQNDKLVRTWETEPFDFHAGCDVTEREKYWLNKDISVRTAWFNQHRILDEILPLPAGPGLVVRSFENGATTWRLHLLRRDGTSEEYAVPIPARAPNLRLEGDVKDDKFVFLVWEYAKKDEETVRPMLYVMKLPQ